MRSMRLVVGAALVVVGARGAMAQQADRTITLHSDGLARRYLLHVPSAGAPAEGWPLVVVLHGNTGDGARMIRLTRFDDVADRAGFAVAYPDGVGRSWADGRGVTDADKKGIDDVAFLDSLIADAGRRTSIDARRLYATGISNGGFMTQRLACDRATKYAAVAIVDALLTAPMAGGTCKPAAPIAVLIMAGTADPLVPYAGGDVRGGRGRVLDAHRSAEQWARWNQCGEPAPAAQLPDSARDGTTTSVVRYGGCAGASAVWLVSVDGGGHTWPGARQYLPRLVIGRTSRDFDASAYVWSFLSSHHR